MRPLWISSSILLACASSPRDHALPLTKLRLYETGVGYFERHGELGGAHGASVPVPASHVDDALKSLVVLGKDGTVSQVAFDSRQSPAVARARAGLPVESTEAVRMLDLLLALRGHEVIVRHGGRSTRGRIVDVVGAPAPDDGDPATTSPTPAQWAGDELRQTFVTLVSRSGRFRRIDLASIASARPTDPEDRRRFSAALDATVDLRSNTGRKLELAGKGGPVRIGSLAEAPVWRASYRLVLADQGASTLQGWALVHNDTDEAWNDLTLELVNGRPDSFLYPLAAPRYERRELQVPERELSSVPQLLTTTPDALWGDFAGDETIGLGNIGLIGHGGGSGSGSGYGYGAGRAGSSQRISSLIEVGDLAALAAGQGKATRTVFVYTAAELVDLAAGRSAMVPFFAGGADATAITWMDDFGNQTSRHAVRLTNSTGQTLPEGTLAVFESGGFAGEVILPRLQPAERRFLSIGDDPDTEMTVAKREVSQETKRVVYERDTLVQHAIRTTRVSFEVDNRSGQPRQLYVGIPAGSNTAIEGADRVDYDLDRGRALAVFDVAAASDGKPRDVVIREGITTHQGFAALSVEVLDALATATSLPANERKIVTEVLGRRRAQAETEARIAKLTSLVAVADADITRLRGHLAAMGEGSGSEKNPLVKRLLQAEDELTRLRAELEATSSELETRSRATRQSLEALAPPA